MIKFKLQESQNEANSPEVVVSEALSDISYAIQKAIKMASKLPDGNRLSSILVDIADSIDEESMFVAKGEYS